MEGTKPVNKKLTAALSGGAVLVLALSGCSSDGGSGSGGGNDKLNSWAKQVCDALKPQAQKIQEANAAIQKQTSDNSTPEAVQKTDAQAFQDMSDAYKALGTAVDNAGPPDVEDGKTKQANAVKELNALSASYADLKTQVGRDVRYLRYWVAEDNGRVFCLVEAPSAEEAANVHRDAHGLVADQIFEVQEGV